MQDERGVKVVRGACDSLLLCMCFVNGNLQNYTPLSLCFLRNCGFGVKILTFLFICSLALTFCVFSFLGTSR